MQLPRNTELVKRHVSNRAVLPLLLRLRRQWGAEAADAAVAAAGLEADYLEDTSNWVSLEFLERLERQIARLHGLDHLPGPDHAMWNLFQESGAEALHPRALGPLWPALRDLASPGRFYRAFPTWIGRWARTTEVTLEDDGPGRVVMSFRPRIGKDPLSFCRGRQGYLRALPTLWGLPPARVEHTTCLHNPLAPADRCEYLVLFVEASARGDSVALALGAALGWAASRLAGFPPLRGAVGGAASGWLAADWLRRRELTRRQAESDAHLLSLLDEFDDRYRALQESEARHWRLLHTATDAIVVHDLQGRVLYVNPAFEEATGYRLDELRAIRIQDLVPEDQQEAMFQRGEARKKGAAGRFLYETEVVARDGRRLPVEVSSSLRSGELSPEVLLIARDIRDRQQAEAAIRRANEDLEERVRQRTAELQEANEDLEAFAHSLAHDLRGPLQRISLLADQVLDEAAALEPDTRRGLRQIQDQARRMASMMQSLLSLSKGTGRELRVARVDLSEVARSVAEGLRRDEPDRQVEVEVQAGVEVEGDRDLLHVVLENLLGNAWKYTGSTAHPSIVFGGRRQNGRLECFVKDNGVGFDPGDSERIFTPFVRLHEDTEYAGLGIGLSTARRIVARHGGTMRAEGRPGQGATFSFDLPAVEG